MNALRLLAALVALSASLSAKIITLGWQANDEPFIVGYEIGIYQQPPLDYVVVGSTDQLQFSYSITQEAIFAVRTVNIFAVSDWSEPITVPFDSESDAQPPNQLEYEVDDDLFIVLEISRDLEKGSWEPLFIFPKSGIGAERAFFRLRGAKTVFEQRIQYVPVEVDLDAIPEAQRPQTLEEILGMGGE